MSPAPFCSVVTEHGPTILRFCRSMLPPADADDAWSETFLAALRAYPDLDPSANVAAWLTTIARRKVIDLTRRRDRAPLPAGDVGTDVVAPSHPEPADEELRLALNSLTEQQRTAVVAHHVVGLPHAQTAELLDITPSAARRSAADGIAKLRANLTKGSPR